ncbi:unnamed protein product [Arctogadus glacialis]
MAKIPSTAVVWAVSDDGELGHKLPPEPIIANHLHASVTHMTTHASAASPRQADSFLRSGDKNGSPHPSPSPMFLHHQVVFSSVL